MYFTYEVALEEADPQSMAHQEKHLEYSRAYDQAKEAIGKLREQGQFHANNRECAALLRQLWVAKGFSRYGISTERLE